MKSLPISPLPLSPSRQVTRRNILFYERTLFGLVGKRAPGMEAVVRGPDDFLVSRFPRVAGLFTVAHPKGDLSS